MLPLDPVHDLLRATSLRQYPDEGLLPVKQADPQVVHSEGFASAGASLLHGGWLIAQ